MSSVPPANRSLVDQEFIRTCITAQDPWCQSHGAKSDSGELGAGILYYGLAYALRAKTCVCLGSGGGFVPRLMRQAQRDLKLEGSRTILVDGVDQVESSKRRIWGSPAWAAPESLHRSQYPDVEILLALTKDAHRDYFAPQGIRIDFLHIDADHHYEGARLDWDLFHGLVPDEGIITLHDTVNYREPCGVWILLEEIRRAGEYSVINFPIRYGTALLKKNLAPVPRVR